MNEGSGTADGSERAGAQAGPQTLAQLQAGGAEVVGSDDQKVGDLKEVGDADLLISRMLRRDLRIPVNRVREVTPDNRVILDIPAKEAENVGRSGGSDEGDPASDFSETTERGQGN